MQIPKQYEILHNFHWIILSPKKIKVTQGRSFFLMFNTLVHELTKECFSFSFTKITSIYENEHLRGSRILLENFYLIEES